MYYTDQVGNVLEIKQVPKRIISLVPSQSEFIWDLGLRNELVGISKFCIHPAEMYVTVDRVGGTKNLNMEKIRKLKPDLIIGNKEENEKLQIEALQKEFNVWMSDIYGFDDVFAMMRELAQLLGRQPKVADIMEKLEVSLAAVKNSFNGQSVAYFIWNRPYMLAAGNTFINQVLGCLGFVNVLENYNRYPELSADALKELNPQLCFLSSEPFPFRQKHLLELKQVLPDAKIMLVDGEMFSWYGSRLLQLPTYIKKLKKKLETVF